MQPESQKNGVADVTTLLERNPLVGLAVTNRETWRLRRDERRVVLYKFDHDTLAATEVYRIHPIDAVLMAILHGQRFEDAVARAASAFHRPPEDLRKWYAGAIAKWMKRGAIEFKADDATIATLDPAQFVMQADSVDLDRWWLYRPLDLTIKVTDSCQRQCRYCSVERRRDHPTPATEAWLRVIDDALASDVTSISLVGGDPLLHRGILELVSHITKRGVQPFVSTKVFVSRATAEALREAGLTQIQFSIESDVEPVEDYLVDSRGATKQILESIENCVAAGMRVRTNSVITPYNVVLFPRLVRRLHDLGVSVMGTSQCGYSLFTESIDELLLRVAEGEWLEREIAQLRSSGIDARFSYVSQDGQRSNFANRAFCTAGVWGVIVNSDGTAALCDDLPASAPFVIGNVFESSLLEVWESEAANDFRTPRQSLFDGTVCGSCEDFERCTRRPRICFRDAFYAYGRAFAPPPYCPKAPPPDVRISH